MQSIKNVELAAIREKIEQLGGHRPPITFIVSNKDHNVRLVPTNNNPASKNVPSGTLVDSLVDDSFLDGSDGSFLLTPQGGLKGTSKPMLYRCLVNENDKVSRKVLVKNPQATSLSKSVLTELVFDLAFQYGTATKAPRKVPVLLNSEKLAQRASNYGDYLFVMNEVRLARRDDVSKCLVNEGTAGDNRRGRVFGGCYGVVEGRLPEETRYWVSF